MLSKIQTYMYVETTSGMKRSPIHAEIIERFKLSILRRLNCSILLNGVIKSHSIKSLAVVQRNCYMRWRWKVIVTKTIKTLQTYSYYFFFISILE